jgi:hypothetical protein
MEQYTAFVLSPAQDEDFTKSEAYTPDEPFRTEIIPLIDTVLKERYRLWHGREEPMKIEREVLESLEKEAKKITADYKPSVDLKKMTMEDLTNFIRLAQKRKQEYAEELKKTGEGLKTPEQTVLRLLIESKRGALFQSVLETEYTRRLERQNKPLKTPGTEPITVENFKKKFIQKMADPKAENNVFNALKLAMNEFKPEEKEKMREHLNSQGFNNPSIAYAMFNAWAKEIKMNPVKTKDHEYMGR